MGTYKDQKDETYAWIVVDFIFLRKVLINFNKNKLAHLSTLNEYQRYYV